MVIWYIKEEDYTCDIVKRCNIKIKKFFNIIKIRRTNKNMCILPIFNKDKISKIRIKMMGNKLKKILYKNDVYNIVLSERLMKEKLLKNIIYSSNINILDGKKLFNYLAYDTIEYVLKRQNIEIEQSEIFILINNNNEINLSNIYLIAKTAKKINVITNHIDKFKILESQLLEEFGITIRVTNNIKSSLIKANLILNIDFPQELINKYKIFREAIIINLNNNIDIESKKFNGINIKSYKCYIPEKYKLDRFNNEIVYESLILNLGNFNNIRKKIKEDKIRVENLIGSNGKINKKEFERILLTKTK